MRPFSAFISPANRTCACMLCLTNSFNSCQSVTTNKEQKRDPTKPKGARHARSFFIKDNRGRISKDNPHCTSAEVAQICEKEFQTVDAKTKAQYSAMHKADVIRFKQEMKTYTEGGRCGLSLLLFLLQTVPVLACFV
jgi:hypothetical protein